SGSLGHCLDDQYARHDRAPWEMTLKEGLIDRDRLDGADPLVGIEALDAVDQQHRITMGQRRHHSLDVKRSDGSAGRLIVHSWLSDPAAAAGRALPAPAAPS